MIRVADLSAAVAAGRGGQTLQSLLGEDPDDDDMAPHVHADQPLSLALSRMGATSHTVLPVVSRANVRTLLGVVTLPDILRAYGVEQPRDVPLLEDESRD
jgi:CBS domain-containing protein